MLFAHAVRQGRGKAGSEPRAKTNPAATDMHTARAVYRLTARAIEEVLKGSSVEAKSPDPCTNEAFTSTALQPDRSEESRLDT